VIDDLDTRVQSVFRPEEVYFPVYGAAEIYDILFERAKRGFTTASSATPSWSASRT